MIADIRNGKEYKMEINPINSINNIQKTEHVDKTKKSSSRENAIDSVNITSQGAEQARIMEMVQNAPSENRADKIAELKKKIHSDVYLTSVIGDELAEKIARSLGIPLN